MKASLRNFLDPMNLWHHSIAFNYRLLQVYRRWLWEPLLENWFSRTSNDGKKVATPSETYTCLECGKEKNMALVSCNDNDEEPSFFCSMSCWQKHGLHVVADRDSDVMGHLSE